jgi:outer membrane protein W
MIMRVVTRMGLGLLLVVGLAGSASAQTVQSISFSVGGFLPRGEDSRASGDVVLANLPVLALQMHDFAAPVVNGEWDLTFGHHIEASFGVGYYGKTVPTFYLSVVNPDGSNINQDIRLRVIPLTAVVRFMPFGKTGTFQPYVGTGVGALLWRYSETGSFVDANLNIFTGRFTSTGTAVGPLLLGGMKIPLGGDVYSFNIEGRYQYAVGKLDASQSFAGPKIDLGGFTTLVGFAIRF